MRHIGSDIASLGEQVFEEIRRAIVTGRLAPGSRHSVVSIADELGVSRTPVREALLTLASHGMVRFERNRGVLILETTSQDIREIFEMRVMLEVPSAANCVKNITDSQIEILRGLLAGMEEAAETDDEQSFRFFDTRFHAEILEIADNNRVKKAVDNTRAQMAARSLSTTHERTLHDIFEVHARIFSFIEARDPDGASKAMLDHLKETATLLMAQPHTTYSEDPIRYSRIS